MDDSICSIAELKIRGALNSLRKKKFLAFNSYHVQKSSEIRPEKLFLRRSFTEICVASVIGCGSILNFRVQETTNQRATRISVELCHKNGIFEVEKSGKRIERVDITLLGLSLG